MITDLHECRACAGLLLRVQQLEKRLANFAHLPAWFGDIQSGLAEFQAHCERAGVTLEQFYADHQGHTPNPARDAVVQSLAASGWSASRIALIARMSERAVRRVMARKK